MVQSLVTATVTDMSGLVNSGCVDGKVLNLQEVSDIDGRLKQARYDTSERYNE